MASSILYSPPCAACKFSKRKCRRGCIFAPYFSPEEHQKFVNVHKIFRASNVAKILYGLHPHQRRDAVGTLVYEAEARLRDPVYGCFGTISFLQKQVENLQKELDDVNDLLIQFACSDNTAAEILLTTAQVVAPMNAVAQQHEGMREC